MRRKIALVAFLAALLAGCGMTPRQKAYAALASYRGLALVVLEARQAGVIKSDVAWARLQELDAAAYVALMEYVRALQWGESGVAEWQAFNAALDKLQEAFRQADKAKSEPLPSTGLPMMEVLSWRYKRPS